MTYPTSEIQELKYKDSSSNVKNWTTSPFNFQKTGGTYNISFAFFDETNDFTGTYLSGTVNETEALTGSSDKEYIKTAFSSVLLNGDPYAVSFQNVADINFSENTVGVADVVIMQQTSAFFASVPNVSAATYLYTSGASQDLHGDISINANLASWSADGNDSGDAIVAGEYSWQVIHEEMLHTLGVDVQAGTLFGGTKDSNKYTVTSYEPLPGMEDTTTPSNSVYATGLQLYDIAALHEIYGANTSTRSGNDTYKEGQGFGTTVNDAFIYTIWDGNGTDTIDASAYVDGVTIDLREGHFSSIGKAADSTWNGGRGVGLAVDNVAVAYNAKIEDAVGTSLADTIHGNDLSNRLTGGAGDDVLHGYDGNDNFFGGLNNDTLYGGSGTDWLYGEDGDDTLYGGSGNDFLYGDNNLGASGNDVIYGDDGDDRIWLKGSDSVFGGAGNDTINMIRDGFANTYNIDGGSGNDFINIDQGDNTAITTSNIEGGAGNDQFHGGAGYYADVRVTDLSGDDLHSIHGHDIQVKDYGTGDDTYAQKIGGFNGNSQTYFDEGGFDIWDLSDDNNFISTIVFTPSQNGNDLNVRATKNGFSKSDIIFEDYYLNSDYRFELVRFKGGEEITFDYVVNQSDYTVGTSGNDASITGTSSNDKIHSFSGDDTVIGSAGDDEVNGGDGFDTISYINATGGVTVDLTNNLSSGALGVDTFVSIENATGSAFADTIHGGSIANTLRGEGGNDTINGWAGADILYGGAGDDFLYGDDTANAAGYVGAGNDTIYGDAGNDTIAGGAGDDTIHGGDDDDTIWGGAGADTIHGDAGNDTLYGDFTNSSGNDAGDIIYGGAGQDTIAGSGGDDFLYGGDDVDTIYGGGGQDEIWGDGGNDIIYGNDDDDILHGGDGEDILAGNGGADTLYGDGGNDQIYGNEAVDTVYGGDGTDWIYGYAADDVLHGGNGNDTIAGDDINNTAGFVGAGDDQIFGDAGNDVLSGGDGNDTINGGADSDTIWGNNGNDILNGDSGIDLIYGQDGNDTLRGGTDTDSDTLLGGDGNDTLYAAGGLDILWGQGGDDTFAFESGSAFSTSDIIKDFDHTTQADKIDLSDLLSGIYDDQNDVITDFVEITDSGANSIIKVDITGSGSFGAGTQIATLEGVTGLTDEVALESAGTLVTTV